MQLEAGLDTGPVFASVRTAIESEETAGELRARLVGLGVELLLRTLPHVLTSEPTPQQGEPTHADKLQVAEFQIDPQRSALELHRLVRAGNPRPGAWMSVAGKRVKVLRGAVERDATGDPGTIDDAARLVTADGALTLSEVQPEGRRPMSGVEWRRGLRSTDVRVDPS
jgi:methionyl-tRNA formyltransferase